MVMLVPVVAGLWSPACAPACGAPLVVTRLCSRLRIVFFLVPPTWLRFLLVPALVLRLRPCLWPRLWSPARGPRLVHLLVTPTWLRFHFCAPTWLRFLVVHPIWSSLEPPLVPPLVVPRRWSPLVLPFVPPTWVRLLLAPPTWLRYLLGLPTWSQLVPPLAVPRSWYSGRGFVEHGLPAAQGLTPLMGSVF